MNSQNLLIVVLLPDRMCVRRNFRANVRFDSFVSPVRGIVIPGHDCDGCMTVFTVPALVQPTNPILTF